MLSSYLRLSSYLMSSSYLRSPDNFKMPPVTKVTKASLELHHGTIPGWVGSIVIIMLSQFNCNCNWLLELNLAIRVPWSKWCFQDRCRLGNFLDPNNLDSNYFWNQNFLNPLYFFGPKRYDLLIFCFLLRKTEIWINLIINFFLKLIFLGSMLPQYMALCVSQSVSFVCQKKFVCPFVG